MREVEGGMSTSEGEDRIPDRATKGLLRDKGEDERRGSNGEGADVG